MQSFLEGNPFDNPQRSGLENLVFRIMTVMLIQLGRYFGASIGVTLFAGMLPDVSLISELGQFMGAFGLLTALCIIGIVNEIY